QHQAPPGFVERLRQSWRRSGAQRRQGRGRGKLSEGARDGEGPEAEGSDHGDTLEALELSRYSAMAPTMSATLTPMARHDVSPGDSMPAACTSRGWRRSARMRKSSNEPSGP